MLVLLPVFILILAALVVQILQITRVGFGYAWLVAVGTALFTWIWVLVMHWRTPAPLVINTWMPGGGSGSNLVFQADIISWPYAFALVSLVLAVVLTASARMQPRPSPWAWAGSLAAGGAGLLAVLAANPLTMILAWTLLDIIEVGAILWTLEDPRPAVQTVVAFAARVGGTLLLLWAMVFSRGMGQDLTLGNVTPQAGLFLLLAVGLRLGVIPLHLPYAEEVPLRRGLGTVLRMVAPASSLLLLGRLPGSVVPAAWLSPLMLLLGLAMLFGAVMWIAARDELAGRPYWLITFGSLALVCNLQGWSAASLTWGVVMVLMGGLLFLFSMRQRVLLALPALGVLGLSALPFTPAASGWNGLVVLPITGWDLTLILVHALLVAGYVRHALAPGVPTEDQERWVQAVYPFGLAILVVSLWLIVVVGWPGSLGIGVWWAGLSSLVLSIGIFILARRVEHNLFLASTSPTWLGEVGRRVGRVMVAVFSLNWLYWLLGFIYTLAQQFVGFLTLILEGEGGVLWALVMLALLATLARSGGLR